MLNFKNLLTLSILHVIMSMYSRKTKGDWTMTYELIIKAVYNGASYVRANNYIAYGLQRGLIDEKEAQTLNAIVHMRWNNGDFS